MAPELLLHGRASKASDVYAFGICMWELLTGKKAFAGVPKILLGHKVWKEKQRPKWPADTPPDFMQLINACWMHNPKER